jgi:uncharacterized PurR-regulated membrane protein YhhQ (DUF165 family)
MKYHHSALIYIAATLIANYTANWFVPIPVGQFAIGTLFFGVTFTQRDRVHKWGKQYVYQMILLAAVLNTIMSVVLGVPSRIIAASFLAILIAESVDTEIFAALHRRSWFVRALSSNAVSIPIDTLIFTMIAFWGDLSTNEIIGLLIGDSIVKYVISFLVALWKEKDTNTKDSNTSVT